MSDLTKINWKCRLTDKSFLVTQIFFVAFHKNLLAKLGIDSKTDQKIYFRIKKKE